LGLSRVFLASCSPVADRWSPVTLTGVLAAARALWLNLPEEIPMRPLPALIAEFLSGKRIAVAGVSRGSASAANAVFGKLRKSGYEVFPVNPNASEVEGVKCYPDLASIPADLDGQVVATHPNVAEQVVRQAVSRNVRRIWFHRSFGQGSVSTAATQECARAGISCIVGGCPLMYCEPVDFAHRCMCAWLRWRGQVPR
jgi:predicted CoA-binding protein